MEDEIQINVLTLNCWGLGLGISKDRVERMNSISEYIASQDYDIVLLQEVWIRTDFENIRSKINSVLPYCHFFDNGIIGTGTCMFSKVRINDVTFHHFGLNGYPHRLTHGDWFGGKGLGVGQIDFKGFNIHIFTSHYHATYNYNPLKDIYLGHRVVHGVESAQWIKLSSSSADLTIYAGDFNNEPKDVPYQIVRYVTPLQDAWVDANGPEGGETSETPANSYTPRSALKESPDGKRIDYILYMTGPNIEAETISCTLPLPNRVQDKPFSFSDHEAVAAKFRVRCKKDTKKQLCVRDYIRQQSIFKELGPKKEVVQKAKDILINSMKETRRAKIGYFIFCMISLICIILSFIPPPVPVLIPPLAVEILLFFARVLLLFGIFYAVMMMLIFSKTEENALSSTMKTLDTILQNHGVDSDDDIVQNNGTHNTSVSIDTDGDGILDDKASLLDEQTEAKSCDVNIEHTEHKAIPEQLKLPPINNTSY